MASNKKKSKKRLARAKVKAADEKSTRSGSKHAAGKNSSSVARHLHNPDGTLDRKKVITGVVIVVFAIVMALSLMLPSLAPIFANKNTGQQQDQQSQQSDSNNNSSDSSNSESSEAANSVAKVDANYSKTVSALEAKLAKDPNNIATLLNLGNDYMNWGYQVGSYSSADGDKSHANDLLAKAMGYYDQYLAKNDSDAVRVNRALCQLYSEDTAGATAALEQLTQKSPNYGPAWANLGLANEIAGNQDAAKTAYDKAKETDPNDEYGAKSFAERRLAQMNASNVSTDSGVTSSSTSGLSDALNASSGLNL